MPNDMQSAAREEAPAMIRILKRIAKRSTAKDSDRIAAANAVLDRGHGKPITPILAATPQDAMALLNYSDEELLKVVAQPAPPPNPLGLTAEQQAALAKIPSIPYEVIDIKPPKRRGNLFTVADSEPAPSLEVDEDDLAG